MVERETKKKKRRRKISPIARFLKIFATLLGIITTLLGIIGATMTIAEYFENRRLVNVSGEWIMTNKVKSTSHEPYQNMQLTYHLFLTQDGKRITGKGEKWLEDGNKVPPTARSPVPTARRCSSPRGPGSTR